MVWLTDFNSRLQISQCLRSGISSSLSSLSVSVKFEVIDLVLVSFSFGGGVTETVGCVSAVYDAAICEKNGTSSEPQNEKIYISFYSGRKLHF